MGIARVTHAGYATIFAGLLGGSILAGPAVVAQTETVGLQDIVVTAEKRSESLQDTPLAISAVTTEMIEARGIDNVGSLSAIAPNLVISEATLSTTSPQIYIRGVGASDTLLTVDSPNALYVDGVVLGRATGAMFDLVDLERIEVLRGPQGTLYGRNTTGGAINIITAKPASEFGITQMLGTGRFNLLQSRTTLDTGDIAHTGLRAKLTYLHKQRNGHARNTLAPDRHGPGAYDVDAFRFAAYYSGDSPITAHYVFDHNVRHSRGIPTQLAVAEPYVQEYLAVSPQLGGSAPLISRAYQNALTMDRDSPLLDKVTGHSLTLDVEASDSLSLRSITAYRSWKSEFDNGQLDGNGGLLGFTVSPAILAPPFSFIPEGINPFGLYWGGNHRKQHQWTQEINIIGNIGETLDYVLGAFYFKEKAREHIEDQVGIVIPLDDPIPLGPGISTPAVGVVIPTKLSYRHISESKALFGQATVHPTDRLSVTGGVRYTWDTRTLHQTEATVVDARTKYGEFTWMANARYKVSDDVSAYARASTGYKAGGFNPRGSSTSFNPEKVTSYEIGVKSELFDRRVRFNIDGFYTRYRDMQISQFEAGTGGATSITVNAGKARYIGIEADLLAQITPALALSGNIGYVSRKFLDYQFRDPATNTLINVADEARFNYSASTTATASIDYTFPSPGFGVLKAHLDYNYRGRVYWGPLDRLFPFNQAISDGPMHRVDGRLTLSDIELDGMNLTFALWGKNLTNNHYLVSGIDFGSLGWANVSYAEPRTWGIDLTLRY